MKVNSMKIRFWITGLFLLTIPFLIAYPAHAATPNWQVPMLQCEEETDCEMRVSPQGTLYIFYRPTLTLYNSKNDGTAPTAHVVAPPLASDLAGRMEFVPYDEIQTVIFFSNSGNSQLLRFDIATNTTTKIDDVLPDGKLTACNMDYRLLYLPGQYISRIGMGTQLVICSYSPEGFLRLHILNVSTLSIIQTLEFSIQGRHYDKPVVIWGEMIGGLDGNIYFRMNTNPAVDVFKNQTNNLIIPQDADTFLFRYAPETEIWSVKTLTKSQYLSDMYSSQSLGANTSSIVNIDTQGNVYIYTSWNDLNHNPHYELLKQTSNLAPLALASDVRNGSFGVFSGITADGYVVSRTGYSVDNINISQINDFLLVTPTFTPSPTLTNTSTNTATYTLTTTATFTPANTTTYTHTPSFTPTFTPTKVLPT